MVEEVDHQEAEAQTRLEEEEVRRKMVVVVEEAHCLKEEVVEETRRLCGRLSETT